jgi:hypothetical protein
MQSLLELKFWFLKGFWFGMVLVWNGFGVVCV